MCVCVCILYITYICTLDDIIAYLKAAVLGAHVYVRTYIRAYVVHFSTPLSIALCHGPQSKQPLTK